MVEVNGEGPAAQLLASVPAGELLCRVSRSFGTFQRAAGQWRQQPFCEKIEGPTTDRRNRTLLARGVGLASYGSGRRLMLSVFETSEMMELITPALSEAHPLSLWKRGFDRSLEEAPDTPRDEPDNLAAAVLRRAEQGFGDPYCDVVAMSSYAWEPELTRTLPALRPVYLAHFTERLITIADESTEPVLQLWIADAAWTRMDHVDPAEAGELQMLICRLICRLEVNLDVIVSQYLRCLWSFTEQALTVDQYVANGALEAIMHLRNLADPKYEPFLVLLEARFLASRVLFDADQGRREGVKLQGDIIRKKVNSLFNSSESKTDRPDLEIPGVNWDISDYRDGLEVLADAELLVGMPQRALATWRLSTNLWPYDGSTNDIALLRRVFTLCYPKERFE